MATCCSPSLGPQLQLRARHLRSRQRKRAADTSLATAACTLGVPPWCPPSLRVGWLQEDSRCQSPLHGFGRPRPLGLRQPRPLQEGSGCGHLGYRRAFGLRRRQHADATVPSAMAAAVAADCGRVRAGSSAAKMASCWLRAPLAYDSHGHFRKVPVVVILATSSRSGCSVGGVLMQRCRLQLLPQWRLTAGKCARTPRRR